MLHATSTIDSHKPPTYSALSTGEPRITINTIASAVAMTWYSSARRQTAQANCANGSGVERSQRDAMLAVCSTAVRRPAR
jgi:hypothetical protein